MRRARPRCGDEFGRGEPGYLLLPIDRLGPTGPDARLAAFLEQDCGWSGARVALLAEGLSAYWSRATALARRTATWPSPRLRNIGIADDATAVRPFAQVLGTGTWNLYTCDLDPTLSAAELVAYLLALGEWMAATGEVTEAPVRAAAWWFDATDREKERFAAAARRSERPDAGTLRAVADALAWIDELGHDDLRPGEDRQTARAIPGTGLRVPRALEARPLELATAVRDAATGALEAHRSAWREDDPSAITAFLEWLADARPDVAITAGDGHLVWSPDRVADRDALAGALTGADRAAVEALRTDLGVVDARTRTFHEALSDDVSLPVPDPSHTAGGYAYLHAGQKRIAYNLTEPGMERLAGPPLPFERSMLGARTLHEWGHLADEAALVPLAVDPVEERRRVQTLAETLDDAARSASTRAAATTGADLQAIARGRPAGAALAELLLTRLPDYRANLVVGALAPARECEVYARHNVRTLGYTIAPAARWRLLLRYAYEYQYLGAALGLVELDDPWTAFARATAIEHELFEFGLVDEARFLAIADAVAAVCACYAIDTDKLSAGTTD